MGFDAALRAMLQHYITAYNGPDIDVTGADASRRPSTSNTEYNL